MKVRKDTDIAVLGIPFDRNSSFRAGASLAPRVIRESLFSDSSNLWTESAIDLGEMAGWEMAGDIEFSDHDPAYLQIEGEIQGLLKKNRRVISIGGDHSITYPIIRAYSQYHRKLNILQFDAHPDLYDELDGNRFSHACPFARIMEENLAARLVQVGVRTLTGHQREQATRFGVEIIEMRDVNRVDDIIFTGPVYLSLDMDCLDPAFAPGVSHHEPGGMSTRDVIRIIQNLKGNLVGADLVEYNPERDIQGMTGMVAAKLLKEMIGRMIGEMAGR